MNKDKCLIQKELLDNLSENDSLREVQKYIKSVIDIRGFGNQPIQEAMLLLLEEVGELAKAVRKTKTNMSVDVNKLKNYDTVESEVADVFIVLSSICNLLNIDMFQVLKDKETENINRTWKN